MIVKKMSLKNYRNIDPCNIEFSEGINIFCGQNGQGKTNILEAVYYFSAGKSFRAGKDKDFIRFGQEEAKIGLEFVSEGILKTCKINLYKERKKEILVGGSKITKRSDLMGCFSAILFAPEHLDLVKDGPSERRKFLDFALCQINPRYCRALSDSAKIIIQKNALLKDARNSSVLADTLDVWNEKLCEPAAIITSERKKYIEKLRNFAKKHQIELSKGKEKLDLNYVSVVGSECTEENELFSLYKKTVEKNKRAEISAGCCLFGPHRDDLEILLGGNPARIFASQGQQRSCVLALKLAEGEIANEIFGEPPVYLFDDIMSELDCSRQEYITKAIKDRQVILTTCEKPQEKTKVFTVENGKIT